MSAGVWQSLSLPKHDRLITENVNVICVAGYFEAPGAPVCGLGRIAGTMPPINLPAVTIVFCIIDNLARMKVSMDLCCLLDFTLNFVAVCAVCTHSCLVKQA